MGKTEQMVGFERFLLGCPEMWLPRERERVRSPVSTSACFSLFRDEEDTARPEKAQSSPLGGSKMSSPFLQPALDPTGPTYKQGILARKMHHDVDGKKSGSRLPCGASVCGGAGGSAQGHVLTCAQGNCLDSDCVRHSREVGG